MALDLATKVAKTKTALRNSRRRVTPYYAAWATSSKRVEARRKKYDKKHARKGSTHVITYFHDVTDPYSHLAAMKLGPLMRTYEIELKIMLVNPPCVSVVPEPEMLAAYSLTDAYEIAPFHKLEFNPGRVLPGAADFAEAGRLLSAAIARSTFHEDAPKIGAALWAGDTMAKDMIKAELPMADPDLYEKHLQRGDKERACCKHYLGAVFSYGGENYWGVDRLYHLEERLLQSGLRNSFAAPRLVAPRLVEGSETAIVKAPEVTLEFFPSLCSPYSYLAMERTLELARRYDLNLVMRPVMPAQGTPVPKAKRAYITSDCKREADRFEIRFGKVSNPVGEPAERALSLFAWAHKRGLDQAFLASFMKASFADGIDGGTDAGMKKIVERAGLSWEEAKVFLGKDDWHETLEENRAFMVSKGLWGVPGFRVSGGNASDEFAAWGQDRLWLIEEEIKRRMVPSRQYG